MVRRSMAATSAAGLHASINVPLSDRVAIRAGGFVKYDPGFTKNLGTGHKDLGNTEAEGGSAAIKFKATDDWDIKVSGLYHYANTKGLTWQENAPGTGIPLYGERVYQDAVDGGVTSKYWLVEATTNYRTSSRHVHRHGVAGALQCAAGRGLYGQLRHTRAGLRTGRCPAAQL